MKEEKNCAPRSQSWLTPTAHCVRLLPRHHPSSSAVFLYAANERTTGDKVWIRCATSAQVVETSQRRILFARSVISRLRMHNFLLTVSPGFGKLGGI